MSHKANMIEENKKKVEIEIEVEFEEDASEAPKFKRDLDKVILSDTQRPKDSETS